MLLCSTFLYVAEAQFNYTINADLTITITGYTGPGGTVTVPNTIQGLPVTTIATSSFSQSGITNIIIPSSVTSLGGVTSGGNSPFTGCSSLLAITVDVNNPYYSSSGGVLFDKNQRKLIQYPLGRIGSYTIPYTSPTVAIGGYAFLFCKLTSISISNSLTAIGDGAFGGCMNLLSVTMPDSVTNIGAAAFSACTSLTNVTMSTAASIGTEAFINCYALPSISIPNGVTSIGDSAFYSCTSLHNITIPSSVTNLGGGAFSYCSSLTNAILGNRGVVSGYAFDTCSNLISVIMQDGAVFIGPQAFINCSSLKSVTIPNSVKYIGAAAFQYCQSLPSVTIGDNVTTVDDSAFSFCISLTNVTIGNGVTNIGVSAFMACTSLATVTIGRNVSAIGGTAFAGCPNLAAVYFQGSAPEVDCCFGWSPCCVFSGDPHSILYFLPGASGWGTALADRPAIPWFLPNPLILTTSLHVGPQNTGFAFVISWATNAQVVVEASGNLATAVWAAISTNRLSNGSSSFSDPQSRNYSRRFYRLRWP
jgi:hypothetical protein